MHDLHLLQLAKYDAMNWRQLSKPGRLDKSTNTHKAGRASGVPGTYRSQQLGHCLP